MDKSQIWPTIHAERRALAADLEKLDASQWGTPSLCTGWTVRDVLAHMTATAEKTPFNFLPGMLANGFSLTKLQNRDIARINATGDTLGQFKNVLDRSTSPPGPVDTWLGEVLIHASDIRRPLGIAHDYPVDAAVRVADSYKRTNLVMGAKNRIAGVKLVATDADWTHGDGPEVKGPMMSLLLAMSGRKAALADLTGDGVATLESRD
ncbi:MAG TPA: maleylpyruvate isomerase family mycothiol-dependent enzyme [Acidimicrobiales bacterium]|nr:maleylpyruvate isomerase family mycothiol-dependent enzyme [Acidimicrobiales bacterium]